jgi:diguanylate cyclase (GGDEF)-like protein
VPDEPSPALGVRMDARASNSLPTRIGILVLTATGAALGSYVQLGDSMLGLASAASFAGLASLVAFSVAKRAQRDVQCEADRSSSDAIAELASRIDQLTERNTRLQRSNQILEQLSITDGLTQLNNHRSFQDHLTREIKRVNRYREPLSLLMIDIDDFKSLNDRFGHAAGDELLRRLAQIMSNAIRESDLLARYGGEEFVVLTPDTAIDGAYQLAEKIRTAIAESSFVLDESRRPTRVTVSIGVAEYLGNRMQFFDEADRSLYSAKAAGKNCVVISGEDAYPVNQLSR